MADDRGECPICGDEFDDPDAFRAHLGEVHDLYDEEGAETTTLWIPAFAVEPAVEDEPAIPEDEPAPVVAPREKAPVGLIVLVLLLLGFGGGLVLYMQSDDGSKSAAETPRVESGSTESSGAPSAPVPTPDSTSSPTGEGADTTVATDTTVAGDPTTATATTSGPRATVPVTEPPPSSTTTTPTTAPPMNFVAPTTTAARVDSCSRDHGQQNVTYSWRYVGGSGWAPLPAYTATAGGRYRHTVTVPTNGHTPIATVGVLDSNGTRHDVALSPTLSSNDC